MKKILLAAFTFLTLSHIASAQQFLTSGRLNYTDGQRQQAGKFEGGGVILQGEAFKSESSKLGLVGSFSWLLAGCESKAVDLTYNNRYGTTNVDYTSTQNKLMGGLIFLPLKESTISPFVSLQGGVLWYRTKFYINDPTDFDNCRPESNRNMKTSFALGSTLESGIRVRVRNQPGRQMYAQAGAGYTVGTKASYIKLGDTPNDKTTVPYTSKFKMGDGSVHAHSVGTMYRTNTSQLSFSLGVVFEMN